MKPPLFTYTIAPLTVLPLKKTLFSYGYHSELALGSVVTVPLSGRTVRGVILEKAPFVNDAAPNWLKNILSVEERAPLTTKQLVLADSVSKITFTPLGRVLKHFVPKAAKARKGLKKASPSFQRFSIDPIIKSIFTPLEKEERIFFSLSAKAKSLEVLGALVQTLSAQNSGQVLVLAPDIACAVRLEKAWEPHFPPRSIASLYHTKTSGQYFQAWDEVQTGKALVIIATRSGMFAPFKSLHTIIQLDPHDESYKQWDMSPRYHTEFILPVLQKLWGAKLIQTAPLPSLFALAEKQLILPLKENPTAVEWINLKIERWQKNWGVFALPTQEAIKQTLAENKQIILYVHQSGLTSFSVCTECRTIFRCPSCGSTLKLTSSDHYRCQHCSFRSALFPQCTQCKGIHFKNVGYGTEKVAKEVQKLFPGAAVSIVDKKHLPDHKKGADWLEKTPKNEPDIVVSTASFLRFPPLSRLALIAIIDADTLLHLPGFRKDEQFLELIQRAKSLIAPKGRILAQTYHPHSDIFQKIDTRQPLSLLQQLLEERQELRYPPYYRAIVLEARPKKKDGAEVLKSVSKKLKDITGKHPRKKELFVQSATRTERGKIKSYTLFRYQEPLPPEITTFLTDHADLIFIDHDPLHIT